MGVDMRTILPAHFPHRLREIPDPPKQLYLEGTLPSEEHKWLCVVGSRKYSNYGKQVVLKLIEGLVGYPVVVVSGLALGIDALAHRAALSAKLPCVAVPGSGLDRSVLHPPSNRPLADEILKAGGALLSEFPPTFPASLWGFPQRNRIMAGLSDAVLIIEAEQKSGTLITSKLATEYNRDVFTVPGSIFSSTSEGPHMLLRLGATPITSTDDLLQALGFDITTRSAPNAQRYDDCTEEERKIIGLLHEPKSREDLLEEVALPTSRTNAVLSLLEIKGLIKESAGEIRLT